MIERSTLDAWLKVSLCYWQLCEGFHVWFEKSFIQFDVRSLLLFSFPTQTLPYHLINDLLVEPGELELKHRTSNRSGNLINISFIFMVFSTTWLGQPADVWAYAVSLCEPV